MHTTTRPDQTLSVPVQDFSQVGEARRAVRNLAGRLGFPVVRQEQAALIATEAASNLVRHAGGGHVLLGRLSCGTTAGLEMLALDQGPGMANVENCLQDGYSTRGGTGTGLGAIRRLADAFDVYSAPRRGTALVARLWNGPASGAELAVGALNVPKPGQATSGDAWGRRERSGRTAFVIADGLGHGPPAAEASCEAVRRFLQSDLPYPALLGWIHQGLRRTRGAAVAIAEIHPEEPAVHHCGIGNVAGAVVSPSGTRSLVSQHGTVGMALPSVRTAVYPLPEGGWALLLCTDGLTSRWSLEGYPGLLRRDPALTAGVLYRDFRRGDDDVALIVACPRRADAGGHG